MAVCSEGNAWTVNQGSLSGRRGPNVTATSSREWATITSVSLTSDSSTAGPPNWAGHTDITRGPGEPDHVSSEPSHVTSGTDAGASEWGRVRGEGIARHRAAQSFFCKHRRLSSSRKFYSDLGEEIPGLSGSKSLIKITGLTLLTRGNFRWKVYGSLQFFFKYVCGFSCICHYRSRIETH